MGMKGEKQMKRLNCCKLSVVAIVITVTLLIFFKISATAEEFTITGYGPSEFSLIGDQKKQAKEMIKGWGNKKPVKIKSEGFADKSGTKAENNVVGRNRANEMKEFLKSEGYSENIISTLSLSDSEDARKVVVTVEFGVVLASVAPEKSLKNEATNLLGFCIGVAIAVVALSGLIAWILRMNKRKKNKIQDLRISQAPTTVLRATPIEITFNGQRYNFWPEVTNDGKLYKTFHEIEPGKVMMLKFNRKYKDSVVSSLKKMPGLYEKLINAKRLAMIA
jgi:hypothetical protein